MINDGGLFDRDDEVMNDDDWCNDVDGLWLMKRTIDDDADGCWLSEVD